MENNSNVTTIIIETINTILQNLFSSIDNSLYSILDDITFISSDIINDSYFEKILGTSSSNGVLLIANSLLFGFVLYYSIMYIFSHFHHHNHSIRNIFLFLLSSSDPDRTVGFFLRHRIQLYSCRILLRHSFRSLP